MTSIRQEENTLDLLKVTKISITFADLGKRTLNFIGKTTAVLHSYQYLHDLKKQLFLLSVQRKFGGPNQM